MHLYGFRHHTDRVWMSFSSSKERGGPRGGESREGHPPAPTTIYKVTSPCAGELSAPYRPNIYNTHAFLHQPRGEYIYTILYYRYHRTVIYTIRYTPPVYIKNAGVLYMFGLYGALSSPAHGDVTFQESVPRWFTF